jgi:hypothetical protein
VLGFCFDSGHPAFGGGDPVAFLDTYGELVTHVHLKDEDGAVIHEIRTKGLGMEEAWRRGSSACSGAAASTWRPSSPACVRSATTTGSWWSRTGT